MQIQTAKLSDRDGVLIYNLLIKEIAVISTKQHQKDNLNHNIACAPKL